MNCVRDQYALAEQSDSSARCCCCCMQIAISLQRINEKGRGGGAPPPPRATFYSIFYCSIIKKRDFAAYLITLRASERWGKEAAEATRFSSFSPSEKKKLNFAAATRFYFWAALELNRNGVRGKRICCSLGAAFPFASCSVIAHTHSRLSPIFVAPQPIRTPPAARTKPDPISHPREWYSTLSNKWQKDPDYAAAFIGLAGLQKQMKFLVNQKRIQGMTDILWALGMKARSWLCCLAFSWFFTKAVFLGVPSNILLFSTSKLLGAV